jgi:PAS domain S-box-containing protein
LRNAPPSKIVLQKPGAGADRLLHELQVHQVELELQNLELQRARDDLEALLGKYTDLYDFAPVGYCSLDELGRIVEVNLAGAALLGVERSRLVKRPLQPYLDPPSRPGFLAFLARVLCGAGPEVSEARILKQAGAPCWVNLHGTRVASVDHPAGLCRLVLSDITPLKQAEEAERRLDALTAANRALKDEIVRRQAVEEALVHTKQHQTELLRESRQMHEQLRRVSHQILQAQEEERKRISRELHDEITQTLVGINVQLETLAREATLNPGQLRRRIARTQRLVEKSVNIVHEFARELRPTALDDLGLIAALHSFMKDFMRRTGVRVRFTAFREIDRLSSDRRTVLYRVVHSALTNVADHAQASLVEVTVRRVAGRVHLEIRDNGRSFNVERVLSARGRKRLGLLGMRERVEMVGGSLAVESVPGQGTTIHARLPFRSDRRG